MFLFRAGVLCCCYTSTISHVEWLSTICWSTRHVNVSRLLPAGAQVYLRDRRYRQIWICGLRRVCVRRSQVRHGEVAVRPPQVRR